MQCRGWDCSQSKMPLRLPRRWDFRSSCFALYSYMIHHCMYLQCSCWPNSKQEMDGKWMVVFKKGDQLSVVEISPTWFHHCNQYQLRRFGQGLLSNNRWRRIWREQKSCTIKNNAQGDHTREIRFDTLAQGWDEIVHALFRVPRMLDFISISRFINL